MKAPISSVVDAHNSAIDALDELRRDHVTQWYEEHRIKEYEWVTNDLESIINQLAVMIVELRGQADAPT